MPRLRQELPGRERGILLLLLLDLLLTVQVLHSLLQFINDGLLTMHELLGIGLIISPLVLVLVFVNSLRAQLTSEQATKQSNPKIPPK